MQYNLTPLVLEQVTLLENLVANIEMISFHMTSKKSNTALTNGSTLSPRHSADPKDSGSNNNKNRVNAFSNAASKNGGGGADATKNPMNLLEMDPESHIPGRPLNRPASTNNMNGISEALVQVETLRIDLERVQMGITLLTLSVEKLKDIVADKSNSSGCCGSGGGIFEFLLMGSSGPSSAGSYTSSSEGGSGRHNRSLPSSSGSSGGGGGNSNRKKLTSMFDSKAKQGYANLGGSADNDMDLSMSEHKEGGSNFFSIESSMDDNDM